MMKFAIIAFVFLMIFLAVYLTITYWVHKARKPTEPKKELLNEEIKQSDTQQSTETK